MQLVHDNNANHRAEKMLMDALSSRVKLPFGLNQNNALVHINDVEKGKKCGLSCHICGIPLIAVKGEVRQHHFRHDNDADCSASFESVIHLAAKQLIEKNKQIIVPECVSKVEKEDSKGNVYSKQKAVVRGDTTLNFDAVHKEQGLNGIIADVLAIKGNKQLIIEIYCTHKVDDEKIKKIKEAGISAIEIDLSDLTHDDDTAWEALLSYINDPCRIKWLHHINADGNVKQELEKELEEEILKIENKYKQEEIIKKRREQQENARKLLKEQKEKLVLLQALDGLMILRSKEHTNKLNQEAETHSAWKSYSNLLQLSLNELPDFLNVDVPDGDWIFGCDRRIWQLAIYCNFFISRRNDKQNFSIKWVDDWLQYTARCKVPRCAEIVRKFGLRYPELVPADVLGNIPSLWRTLQTYFEHLCELGMLVFSGNDSRYWGSCWYEIINKASDAAQCK